MFVFVHAYVLLMLMVTHKGVNWHSKYITQVQQQRPKSPTVILTRHACKYKVHKLHQRYIPPKTMAPSGRMYMPYISGTLDDTGVHGHKTEPICIQGRT